MSDNLTSQKAAEWENNFESITLNFEYITLNFNLYLTLSVKFLLWQHVKESIWPKLFEEGQLGRKLFMRLIMILDWRFC